MSRQRDESFTDFVTQRAQALYGAALELTHDRRAAEELLQRALLRTYRAWPRIEGREQPETYARQAMLDAVRPRLPHLAGVPGRAPFVSDAPPAAAPDRDLDSYQDPDPPYLDARELVRRTRLGRTRRRWTTILAVAIGTACVALAVWWSGSDTPRPAAQPPWGPWLTERHHLHLGTATTADVSRVQMLVGVPDGAVLATAQGQVFLVDRQQNMQLLATGKQSRSRLAADPDSGVVSWITGRGKAEPAVVVYDTRAGVEIGRWRLAAGHGTGGEPAAEPISVTGSSVLYRAADGDWLWDPVAGIGPDRARRIAAGDATGAPLLSPDGRYRMDLTGPGALPRITDATTGEVVPVGLPPDAQVLDAVFGPGRSVTYAVGVDDEHADLVSCELESLRCDEVWSEVERPVRLGNGMPPRRQRHEGGAR